MDKISSLVYENAAGGRVVLSGSTVKQYWELGNRTGFTAPDVNLIKEKYVNGNERIVNRIIEPRTVSFVMVVTGKTEAIRDKIFADMVDILMDTSKGEVGKLYIGRSDGRTVFLNCAYSGGLNISEQCRTLHRFTLEFYAADPYFYTLPITQTVEFSNFTPITLAENLFLGIWRLGWGTLKGTAIVENRTGHLGEPIYEIAGTRNDFKIRNHSRQEQISFKHLDMANDDKSLVVDTRSRYKSAYVRHSDDTVSTALGSLEWSAISLSLPMPEGNSYISIETLGENHPLEVTIMTESLSA